MKQFVLIAHDATDAEAPARRQTARTEHLRLIAEMRERGHIICGIALTDGEDNMNGSVIVANFESREEFDNWLKSDPYTINKVWGEVTVYNGKLAPAFIDLIAKGTA